MTYLLILVGLAIYCAPLLFIAQEFHRDWIEEHAEEEEGRESMLTKPWMLVSLALWFILPVLILLWLKGN